MTETAIVTVSQLSEGDVVIAYRNPSDPSYLNVDPQSFGSLETVEPVEAVVECVALSTYKTWSSWTLVLVGQRSGHVVRSATAIARVSA